MGDDRALCFGEQLRAVAADLDHMRFERLRIAGVDAVLENIPDGFICPELPHLVAAPDFCQIGGGRFDTGRIQLLRDLCDADALRGPLKYLSDDIGGRWVNYDSVLLLTLLIAVGYSAKGIFAIQLFAVCYAFDLAGQIAAVQLVQQVGNAQLQTAGGFTIVGAVKVIVDGDETDAIRRKYKLQIVSALQKVSGKAAWTMAVWWYPICKSRGWSSCNMCSAPTPTRTMWAVLPP